MRAPAAIEIDRARRIVAACQTARARGHGTAMLDGEFIAIDIALAAERTLTIARRAGVTGRPRAG